MLAWSEVGDPRGPVVVFFHGTDNGKHEIQFPAVPEKLGIRLLMADRPGYGTSPAAPKASLLDVGRMVVADLDDRNVDRFAVIGHSGGGPYALACADVATNRVTGVGLLSSWAPMTHPDPGLPTQVALSIRASKVLPRAAMRGLFLLGGKTCLGMVDDVRRVARPWQFDVEQVASRLPVLAWHSEHDPQVPIAPWRSVAGVDLTVVPGDTHALMREIWRSALQRLAG